MNGKKIVLLGGDDEYTNYVYNRFSEKYNIEKVIIDAHVPLRIFIKKRIKKLGIIKVIGQILFVILCSWPLRFASRKRIETIKNENNLDGNLIPEEKVIRGYSVNSEVIKEKLKEINPDLILVQGTRIISKDILDAVSCNFINIHSGITPKYRGVHGMYWALVQKDIENCGVTVHLVDQNIDTGSILYQSQVLSTPKDNFTTYFYLQLSKGLLLLDKAIQDALTNNLKICKNNITSCIWTHPTLWEYIYYRVFRNVK